MLNLTSMIMRGVIICGYLVLMSPTIHAQQSKSTQTAGVTNSPMGAYRALADLSYEAFLNREPLRAAELARILERTWDAAEERGGPMSLAVRNKTLFDEIDMSMDGFIKPLIHYATKTPDPRAVEAAYKGFIEKLREGDAG